MIESRYKIEYVLPDEESKKGSSLSMLWYLFLTPLMLVLVIMITYDFSLKDISRDSLVLLDKAKVHIFNLGETNPVEKTTVSNTLKTPIPAINRDNRIITELTAKQALQRQSIQNHIIKNTELTQNLNMLSEKLVLEQIRNQKLDFQLADQEKDRIELEEQLNKALADSIDIKAIQEEITVQLDQEKLTTKEPQITKNAEVPISNPIETVKEDTQTDAQIATQKETEKSETDKIIETMTNNTLEKQEEDKAATVTKIVDNNQLDLPTKSEEITIPPKQDSTVSEEVTSKKDIVLEIDTAINETVTSNEDIILKKDLTTNDPVASNEEIISKEDVPVSTALNSDKEITKTDDAKKVIATESVTTDEKVTAQTAEKTNTDVQVTNSNSAVDDIIAAMQAAQSNTEENNTLEKN